MEKQRGWKHIHRFVRIAIPVIMIGIGALTVAVGGMRALLALLPILAAHVAVVAVAYPLWVRHKRKRQAALRGDDG